MKHRGETPFALPSARRPPPHLQAHAVTTHDERSDRNSRVHDPRVPPIPGCARVDMPALALERRDELNGLDLGGAADSARRKHGPESVHGGLSGGKLRAEVGDNVHDVGEALDVHKAVDLDTAGRSYATQIIASEIDLHKPMTGSDGEQAGHSAICGETQVITYEHDVLCSFLLVSEQLCSKRLILSIIGTAAPSASNRMRKQRALPVDSNEHLR
jgi:hypothetical protein